MGGWAEGFDSTLHSFKLVEVYRAQFCFDDLGFDLYIYSCNRTSTKYIILPKTNVI